MCNVWHIFLGGGGGGGGGVDTYCVLTIKIVEGSGSLDKVFSNDDDNLPYSLNNITYADEQSFFLQSNHDINLSCMILYIMLHPNLTHKYFLTKKYKY